MKAKLNLFLLVTAIALLTRLFLFEPYVSVGAAMQPTVNKGNYVLVSKFTYSLRIPFSTYELLKVRSPALGEVVVFNLPYQSNETLIQRVVAIGGDKVEVADGMLLVNGKSVGEKIEGTHNYGPVDVPPEHFFALNDDRKNTQDSRQWGPIPDSCIKGRAQLVWDFHPIRLAGVR